MSQCGLRPRIHPQFVCRMKACLAKQEAFVGSQPSPPPSLELENAVEQKQAAGVGPQGRINARNKQIEELFLMSVWNIVTERSLCPVLNLVPVAWSGLRWGPAEVRCCNTFERTTMCLSCHEQPQGPGNSVSDGSLGC